MQRRENAALGLAYRAKIIAPCSVRIIALYSARVIQCPCDTASRQHHTAALLALESLALLIQAPASCVSQEHTSRPGNLALVAGQFTVSNMVTFVALAPPSSPSFALCVLGLEKCTYVSRVWLLDVINDDRQHSLCPLAARASRALAGRRRREEVMLHCGQGGGGW